MSRQPRTRLARQGWQRWLDGRHGGHCAAARGVPRHGAPELAEPAVRARHVRRRGGASLRLAGQTQARVRSIRGRSRVELDRLGDGGGSIVAEPALPAARLPGVGPDRVDDCSVPFLAEDDAERKAFHPMPTATCLVRPARARIASDALEDFFYRLAERASGTRPHGLVAANFMERFGSRRRGQAQALHGAMRLASTITSSASCSTDSPRS